MNNVFIGAGVIVLPNVRIGPDVVVAAGSVVNKDIPSNSVYAGVPAKRIGAFEDLAKKYLKNNSCDEMGNERISSVRVDRAWEKFYRDRA